MKILRAVLDWLRADRATLPAADPALERTSRIVVALCTLWFALAAAWEIAGPFGAGHHAASTAVATAGENMWRWGLLGAVNHVQLTPPHDADFYCHHPWGVFWTAALFVKTFGHHYWVCRLPAVLMSIGMPPLLYACGRALWSPVAGAATALGFVVLPLALAFANFHALEVPVIFGVTLCIWGYVRLAQTGRRRWLWLSLFGLVFAEHADWAAFVFGALLLAALFVRGFVLRRFFAALDLKRFVGFWAWAACLSLASAAFYLIAFASLGQLEQFLRQGEFRSSGAREPLAAVLESRRGWIELAFTPLAVVLGKLAAPVFALRLALLRRDGELLPLAVLGMAVFQYVVFKQGADIHVFWPHYFALYFAFALGVLTESLQAGLRRLVRLVRRPQLERAGSLVALASACAVGLAMLPDAWRGLVFGRQTGGRFNEKGSIIQPDIDKVAAFEFLSPRLKQGQGLLVHPGMKPSYWMDWTLQRPVRSGRLPRKDAKAERYFMLDSRFAPPGDLAALLEGYAPLVVGPYWFVDRSRPAAPLEAFQIALREPGFFERYFVLGTHALRSVEPDPWLAWELAHHYGAGSAPSPSSKPLGFEALRAAHNQALSAGDAGRADELARALLAGTDPSARCRYDDGSELVAVRFEPGTSAVLTVYLRAGSAERERRFGIESLVEAPPRWSLVPADSVQRDVGMPPGIAPARWKAGYLYSTVTELMKRPGRERYVGRFRGEAAPQPVGCSPEQTLLVLE
jgi:4-amino-4-deoxy-L-arabinose transferase-like glycosyltransferase